MYLVGELSEQTGVTIKTLHYYERLGLLTPGRHAQSGYRIYDGTDILRLQEISVLKQMGFPLSRIKDILDQQNRATRNGSKEDIWKKALTNQMNSLREEQLRLSRIEQLLQGSLYSLEVHDEVKLDDITRFIKELQNVDLEDHQNWRSRHFTPEEMEKLPPKNLEDPLNQEWARLLKEIRRHVQEPADSPASLELAQRILKISEQLFHGDEALTEKFWDQIRPAEGETPIVYGLDKETMAYIDQIVDYYLENAQEELTDGTV